MDGTIRVGTVTDIKEAERQVRVHFPDVDIVSGWLKVIKNAPFIPDHDVDQKTEATSGGTGEASFASHTHNLIIKPWLPKIGETVLCVYDSGFNADGYVLGAM